jgi:hypothetical protein
LTADTSTSMRRGLVPSAFESSLVRREAAAILGAFSPAFGVPALYAV